MASDITEIQRMMDAKKKKKEFELTPEEQLEQDEMVANAEKKRAEMRAQGLPMAADILKKDEAEKAPVVEDDLGGLKGAAKPAAIPEGAKMRPDQAKKKEELSGKVEMANKAITGAPDDQLDQGIKADINKDPETMPPEIKNDLKWLQGKYAQLDKEYVDKEGNLEWRAVMETVAQSLTQLFAAREGLQAGVDMSGLKFNKTDFDKKLDQVTADINRRKGQAENIYKESDKAESAKAAGIAAGEEKAYQRGKDDREFGLKEEDLALRKYIADQEAANKRELAQAKAATAAKGTPLDKEAVNDITNFNSALTSLKGLKEDKATYGIDTGKIASARNWLAEKVGVDDPNVTIFKQNLRDLLAAKVKALSGAAASNQERAFLAKTLPTMEMNDEQFLAALENTENKLREMKRERLNVLKKAGKDVSEFEDEEAEVEVDQDAKDLAELEELEKKYGGN